MEFKEAREKFIQAWGTLGSGWGINRTMAQIHALLLISSKSLTTEEVMAELQISRGNANMNLRALIDWGIVQKETHAGERKEYFYSEKDIWELATQVARERRKRELDPVLRLLKQVKNIDDNRSAEAKEFKKVTANLDEFARKMDNLLDIFTKAEQNWFFNKFLKLFK